MKHSLISLTTFLLLLVTSAAKGQVPTRYGAGLTVGNTYDPATEITWVQGTLLALFDYDSVWPHRAPEPLRFKVEAHAGMTVRQEVRAITSMNIFAHYYLNELATGPWRPYVEAGIGLIYTDFQVEGQGLSINFNPQMGIGTEYTCNGEINWFVGLRAHHISNAGLNEDNRGINSVTLTFGRYF